MTDLQRTIDEIRFALQAQVCELTDGLRATADAYAAACHDANDRLRRCDDLLRRNLRSEAIHLADADPNLLDVVATLDFPERQEWSEIVAVYDLTMAEPLLVDIAQELNQAYAAVEPLQKLLNKHRLLALTRAPLAERLAVMRNLSELDQESPFWDDDIRTFERARFEEIDAAAKDAARRHDEPVLAGLFQELRADAWREEVPPHLLGAVKRYAGSVAKAAGSRKAEDLAVQLEEAFHELDLGRARALRADWLSATARARLPQDDPLRERVEPILGWIDDEDAREAADRGFETAVAGLERALDTDAELDELERLYHASLRFERTPPDSVMVRYRNRTEALAVMDQRVRRLKIGIVAAMVLGVGLFAAFLTRRNQQQAAVAALTASVTELINGGSYEDARQMLDSRPELADREELLSLSTRITQDEKKDVDRKARFEKSLSDAEAADSYQTALTALTAARKQARFEPETISVDRLEQSWTIRNQEDLAAKEAVFRERLEAAAQQHAALQAAIDEDPESERSEELLQSLSAAIAELRSLAMPLRKELGGQVDLLAARHQAHQAYRNDALHRRSMSLALTSRSLIPPEAANLDLAVESLAKAMSDYGVALKDDPRAAQFQEILAERSNWGGSLAWQRMMKGWSILLPPTMEEVGRRKEECQRYLETFGNCPEADDAREYLAALQSILAREAGPQDSPNESLRARLRRSFSHDLIANAWVLKTGDGRVYYVGDSEDQSGHEGNYPVAFLHRIGFLPEDMVKARDLKAGELAILKAAAAPQNTIAKVVRDRTDLIKMNEWEPFLLELATQINNETALDAFLRYDLLKRVLETGSAASIFFKEAVSPQLSHLQRTSIDPLARWMDPHKRGRRQGEAGRR